MRKDLAKVLTEQPRRGSGERNVKTRFHDKNYDERESKEDKYSLPKLGKMLMNSRDLGPHDGGKEFTDKLNPLRRWVESQVGRNWDRVYSEVRKTLPNTNKQNHHLIDTHLMSYINQNVEVIKSEKGGRRVYDKKRRLYDTETKELMRGDIYVDPDTHVLMRYNRGKEYSFWKKELRGKKLLTETGYEYADKGKNLIELDKKGGTRLEKRGPSWVWCQYEFKVSNTDGHKYVELVKQHSLSKKELIHYGVKNDNKI